MADLRDRALRILQERDHSCQELRCKLLARGESAEALEPLLQDLLRLGYLDDHRYAVQFARDRIRRGKGRLRVVQELVQRGIPRDQAEQVWEQESPEGEVDRAEALARQRAALGRSAESTARFLAGRGFTASTIRAVLGRAPRVEDD